MSFSRTLFRTALSTARLPTATTATTATTLARSFHASARRHDVFVDVDTQTFRTAVANKDKVVLVDFYADWCGPCKQLSPVLERLVDPSSGTTTGSDRAIDLVTVDVDVEQELAQEYRVTSLPTIIAFRDGKPLAQFVGAVPEGSVRNFLKSL